MTKHASTDCLVIGGGIVGLSIAYRLAGEGRSVRLLESGTIGKQASWAGAGILPPGSWFSSHPALAPLAKLCGELHPRMSAELLEATGIDDEFEACGALYAAGAELPAAARSHQEERMTAWSTLGIEHQPATAGEVAAIEPGLLPFEAVHVRGEAQVRNPRRLAALVTACEQRGVRLAPETPVEGFGVSGDRIESVATPRGSYAAGEVCLASGAWTGALGERLGLSVPTVPIRGQIVLLRCVSRPFRSVVHWGGKYLTPRRDGRVLVGATVEHAGFDTTTDESATEELLAFARRAAPCLADAKIEAAWAGLRPASGDELPMIGRLPGLANGWIAAGHFRSGLQFAPGTAVLLSEMLDGRPTSFDAAAFDPGRFARRAVVA